MTAVAPTQTVFIDTNVWLYAFIVGQDAQKTARARHLIQTTSAIIVSTQVINEVCAIDEARTLYRRADAGGH